LTIQIVTLNSAIVLGDALESLKNLPRYAVDIRVIDNASDDESVSMVRRIIPWAEVTVLEKNIGFAAAHNMAIDVAESDLIMLHNPDLVINWAGVQRVMAVFDDANIGAAQGKLYRHRDSKVIDSTGVTLSRALNGIERGAGEVDVGQYDTAHNLIAVTGAAGIYRLKALKDVAWRQHEFLDEDFFAYMEDVDLGWRLVNAGWIVTYVPILMGWHDRSVGVGTMMEWSWHPRQFIKRIRDKRTRYSLRNWIWMAVKNASFKQMIRSELFFDARLLFFFMVSLFYWPLFGVWLEALRGMSNMLDKRRDEAKM